ncbi:MAG: trypsin-like peptidase domain-containing protein [Verrucomicrobia bacterium]|nr:trypsin-like peptidase domain-containing protein [Verrucomicrobiota bacterium]
MPLNLSPSEQLAYTTVRIECDTVNGQATGTGFYFAFCRSQNGFVPAIVTNRHVVAGSSSGRIHIHLAQTPDAAPTTHNAFDVPDFEKYWIGHPDSQVDLCVMPIAPLLHFSEQKGQKLFFIPLDRQLIPTKDDLTNLMAIEEVVMVGYPNGIWDHVNNMPVFRRGITATHPNTDYCGRKEFMIDAACFPGSSGSPVLLYNSGNYSDRMGNTIIGTRIKLLGVLYAGPQHTATGEITIANVPTASKPVAISRIPNNLGIIIKAERLMEFDPILAKLTGNAPGA